MSYKKYLQKGTFSFSLEDEQMIDAIKERYPNLHPDIVKLMVGTKYLKDVDRGESFLKSMGLDYQRYRKKLRKGLEDAGLYDLADNVDYYLGTYNQPGNKSYGELTKENADIIFPFDAEEEEQIRYEVGKDKQKVKVGEEKLKRNPNYTKEDIYDIEMRKGSFLPSLFGKEEEAVKVSDMPMYRMIGMSRPVTEYPYGALINRLSNMSEEEKKERGLEGLKVEEGKYLFAGKTPYGVKSPFVVLPKGLSKEEKDVYKQRIADFINDMYTTEYKKDMYEEVDVPVYGTKSKKKYVPKFQAGGMIEGEPHEGGGVPITDEIEAEGGEVILSVQASNALNQAVMAYQQAMQEEDTEVLEQIAMQVGQMILQERMKQMEEEMSEAEMNAEMNEEPKPAMKGIQIKKRLEKLNEF